MLALRESGLPLEQAIGWADFCGVRIALAPGVFVPRHRTELLLREAIALGRPGCVVVDLCCGSGAIGAALAAALGDIELHAADLDQAAVACARRNLDPIGGRVHEGDLYAPLPSTLRGRVDILAANVPYVPTADIAMLPPEARLHEPHVSLDGGPDGLDVLRRVAAGAPAWLAPGGTLLTETSTTQAQRAAAILGDHGLTPRVVHSEELEATVVLGRLQPSGS